MLRIRAGIGHSGIGKGRGDVFAAKEMMTFDREFVVNAGAHYRKLLLAGTALATVALLPTTAAAQTWNGISGSWNNAANWTPAAVPNAVDATATFNAVSPGASFGVLLGGGPFTIGTLNLNSALQNSGFQFQGGTMIMQTSAGVAAINVQTSNSIDDFNAGATLQLNSDTLITTASSSAHLTIDGLITGAGGLGISGPGIVTLNHANTYSGVTAIGFGALRIGTSDALGSVATGGVVFTGDGRLGADNTATLSNTISIFPGVFATIGAAAGQTLTLNTPNFIIGNNSGLKFGSATDTGTVLFAPTAGTTIGPFTQTYEVVGGTLRVGSSMFGTSFLGSAASTTVDSGATLDMNGFTTNLHLLGAGTVATGGATLNLTGLSNFAGAITGTGALNVVSGTTVLSGTNTYTGGTTVNGVLSVNGSIASSALTTVNAGGTLGGSGIVGNTTVASGGSFAPGSGTPGTSMTVSGSLAFQSGALYLVQVNPATSSFANVTGTATLNGATVQASFANGSYVQKRYTIVTATGGVNGTFNPTVSNTNLPAGFTSSLSYDANDAYLQIAFSLPSGLNANQQAVGNALTNFFNSTGGIPLVFTGLSPAGLTQASGEAATGSQQATFNAMTQFMGVMTDPFITGRGDGPSAGGGANGYADDNALAYAGKRKPNDALAAIYTKAPPVPFVPSWSVWAAGFGGSQTTSGDPATGSNNTTSRMFGTAVGADYRFSPSTIAGFSMAGGGTNFNVNNSGYGRSDLFQAGAFVRHNEGAAYIMAAAAYGWQDITTNRTVTIAGTDQLQARFTANAFSGRAEGGYRFLMPWAGGVGLTPYAAAQFTTFDLPAYAESAVSGANAFALAYGSKSVTDTRSEFGLRADKSYALTNSILTLRGRLAWAHDFNPDRSIGATFQTLPGASFVVNGAAQAHDSALTTASAEMKFLNGWALAATFEGEFSDVSRSYAGKGVVKYAW
jgi:autotransporter-associated beta strand protein